MKDINLIQLDNMLHALGRPTLRKNWKAKTILDKCYRNKYFVYEVDSSWEDLIEKGFASKRIIKNFDQNETAIFYSVTEKGVERLKLEVKNVLS